MVHKNITNGMIATDLEHFLLVLNRGYAYDTCMIVHTNAVQVLPELLMDRFDTLPTQWGHIEHMHEGVLFKSNYY